MARPSRARRRRTCAPRRSPSFWASAATPCHRARCCQATSSRPAFRGTTSPTSRRSCPPWWARSASSSCAPSSTCTSTLSRCWRARPSRSTRRTRTQRRPCRARSRPRARSACTLPPRNEARTAGIPEGEPGRRQDLSPTTTLLKMPDVAQQMGLTGLGRARGARELPGHLCARLWPLPQGQGLRARRCSTARCTTCRRSSTRPAGMRTGTGAALLGVAQLWRRGGLLASSTPSCSRTA